MNDSIKGEIITLEKTPTEFSEIEMFINPDMFGQLQRVANLMASSALVPAHLQGKVADCFLVLTQAIAWRKNPFMIAQMTYVVSGRLGYEGKLVAGVVNGSGRTSGNLNYSYSGAGEDRKVIVIGRIVGETEDRTIEGTVKGWKTQNQKWKEMPDQMLAYRGAREWTRRHCPEVLFGVLTDDEVEDIAVKEAPLNVTPTPTQKTLDDVAAELKDKATKKAKPESSGNQPMLVHQTTSKMADLKEVADISLEDKIAVIRKELVETAKDLFGDNTLPELTRLAKERGFSITTATFAQLDFLLSVVIDMIAAKNVKKNDA